MRRIGRGPDGISGPGDYVRPMNHTTFSMTGYDWFRAYTALSRSGSVSEEIRACERAWGAPFQRDEAAVREIRTLPEYPSYAAFFPSR
jgi:hypothetical protein